MNLRIGSVAAVVLLLGASFGGLGQGFGGPCDTPTDEDPDGDYLFSGPPNGLEEDPQRYEGTHGTDPCDPDSDGDGLPDGWEVLNGLDPADDSDFDDDQDDDGLVAWQEYCLGLDGTTLPDRETCRDRTEETTARHEERIQEPRDPHPCPDDPAEDCYTGVYWGGTSADDPDSDDDDLCDGGGTDACREVHLTSSPVGEVLQAGTVATNPDTDGDEMHDGWEHAFGLDPHVDDADEDKDGDSFDSFETEGVDQNWTNIQEYRCDNCTEAWSRPDKINTDGDCAPDGWEVHQGADPTDPNDQVDCEVPEPTCDGDPEDEPHADWDGDGLSNLQEDSWGSDPCEQDTDGDNLTDDLEWRFGSDPNDEDTDDDSPGSGNWGDWGEVLVHGCNPSLVDTDGDDLPDPDEDPNDETTTHCTRADTDGDGIIDGTELDGFEIVEPNWEADGETQRDDPQTIVVTSDPLVSDSDGDGLTDGQERRWDTHPRETDTDGDGVCDEVEATATDTSPREWDTDGDGTSDSQDVADGACDDAGTGASQSQDTGASSTDTASSPLQGTDGQGIDGQGIDDLIARIPGLGMQTSSSGGGASSTSSEGCDTPDDPFDDAWNSDCDGDGLTKHEEWRIAPYSDPTEKDSDDDYLSDFAETHEWASYPGYGMEDSDFDIVPDVADRNPDTDEGPPAVLAVRGKTHCNDPDGDKDVEHGTTPSGHQYETQDCRHWNHEFEIVVYEPKDHQTPRFDKASLEVEDADGGNCNVDADDASFIPPQKVADENPGKRWRLELWFPKALHACDISVVVEDQTDQENGWEIEMEDVHTATLRKRSCTDALGIEPLVSFAMGKATGAIHPVGSVVWDASQLVVDPSKEQAIKTGISVFKAAWELKDDGAENFPGVGWALTAGQAAYALGESDVRGCDQDDTEAHDQAPTSRPMSGSDRAITTSAGNVVVLHKPGFYQPRVVETDDGERTVKRGAGMERVREEWFLSPSEEKLVDGLQKGDVHKHGNVWTYCWWPDDNDDVYLDGVKVVTTGGGDDIGLGGLVITAMSVSEDGVEACTRPASP